MSAVYALAGGTASPKRVAWAFISSGRSAVRSSAWPSGKVRRRRAAWSMRRGAEAVPSPYSLSPRMGQPRCFIWARSWCMRPVLGRSWIKEACVFVPRSLRSRWDVASPADGSCFVCPPITRWDVASPADGSFSRIACEGAAARARICQWVLADWALSEVEATMGGTPRWPVHLRSGWSIVPAPSSGMSPLIRAK